MAFYLKKGVVRGWIKMEDKSDFVAEEDFPEGFFEKPRRHATEKKDLWEVLKCEHCEHNHGTTWIDCELLPQMFGRMACKNYCSLAAPKEEPDVSKV